ncbi:MAG TPA: hypothetical protein ENN19_01175 [Chloroflexi bacterium]|nr:hypothetical protein [Chloroflexota bacterium]
MKKQIILTLALALILLVTLGYSRSVAVLDGEAQVWNALAETSLPAAWFDRAEQADNVYWVSPDGQAVWASCTGATPLNGVSACSLATANANVAPGDTVYLRQGTYYPTGRNDCIHPGQSGTPGNRIVYASYHGESVTIDGTNSEREAILFSPGWNTGNPSDGRSYITVRGIDFANWDKLGDLYYASYNERADCEFSGRKGDGMGVGYIGFEISHESTHNWIHGNTWHTYGHYVDRDAGVIFSIGFDLAADSVNSGNDYNFSFR